MRRKTETTASNATHGNPAETQYDARLSIQELSKRIEALERAVEQLKAEQEPDVDRLPKTGSRKRGPKSKHHPLLLSDRDRMVEMLESFWPEIEPLCTPRPNSVELKRVLKAIGGQMQGRYKDSATHLLRSLPVLVSFLYGDRFRSNPRNIANALAGVPRISTWRSLKICQASSCNLAIGDRAIRAYTLRKHPALHEKLNIARSMASFAGVLKTYSTKDARLKQFSAEALFYAWGQCKADYKRFDLKS
jgi:uncharacterized small protein (DUF1192 family)